jgi:hypothetical protein
MSADVDTGTEKRRPLRSPADLDAVLKEFPRLNVPAVVSRLKQLVPQRGAVTVIDGCGYRWSAR